MTKIEEYQEVDQEVEDAISCLVLDAGLSYEEAVKRVNAVIDNDIKIDQDESN